MQQVRHIIFNIALCITWLGASCAILGTRGIIQNIPASIIAIVVGAIVLIIQTLSLLLSSNYTPVPPNKPMGVVYVINILLAITMIPTSIFYSPPAPTQCSLDDGSALAVSSPVKGIGIIRAPDGECIGINDGSFASNSNGNSTFWKDTGTNDAEQLIYEENNRIKDQPHVITIVVATMLTGGKESTGAGHDDLQGAYVLQKEANGIDNCPLPGCLKVRLLVANTGGDSKYATTIAQQIVQLAASDLTFVGVMGWPDSTPDAIDGIHILAKNHILMVSPTASSDALTAISPYFFRVAPADSKQGRIGAQYAESYVPNARNAVVFYASDNPYSQTLASAFIEEFAVQGNINIITEQYKRSDQNRRATISSDLDDVHSKITVAPDLIYFAGYSDDLSSLLNDLNSRGMSVPVFTGDAGYGKGFNGSYKNFYFTAFASPDEWKESNPCYPGTSSFGRNVFIDYKNDFDPNDPQCQQHQNDPYGFTRADNDTIMAYDATRILLQAYLLDAKHHRTRNSFPQGFYDCPAFQGVSGQITFGFDGDPINKAVVTLYVDAAQQTHFRKLQGGTLQATNPQGCVSFAS